MNRPITNKDIGSVIKNVPKRKVQGHASLMNSAKHLKRNYSYQTFFFKKKNIFILFIYFWLHWVFVVVRGLSLVAVSRGYSSLCCADFSLRRLLLLWSTNSSCTAFSSCGMWAQQLWLTNRLSSCGAQAQLLCSMWDLP